MASSAERYQKTFIDKLRPVMYPMVLHRFVETPIHCSGGWDTARNEYDAAADTAYHIANPEAPVCRHGLVGTIEIIDIKGFYFDNLKESMLQELRFGVLDVNEGVLIVDGLTDLTHVIVIEYPTGVYYYPIFIRPLNVATTTIAQFAKVRKAAYP